MTKNTRQNTAATTTGPEVVDNTPGLSMKRTPEPHANRFWAQAKIKRSRCWVADRFLYASSSWTHSSTSDAPKKDGCRPS